MLSLLHVPPAPRRAACRLVCVCPRCTLQRHDAKRLRALCMAYIASHFAAVRATASFKRLDRQLLLQVIMAVSSAETRGTTDKPDP